MGLEEVHREELAEDIRDGRHLQIDEEKGQDASGQDPKHHQWLKQRRRALGPRNDVQGARGEREAAADHERERNGLQPRQCR